MNYARLLFPLVLAALLGCPGYVGVVDGGPDPDPDPDPDVITAADIGTVCEYDAATGLNPTNQCARGLTCLIRTFDGAFTPFPAGDPRNLTLGVWEDQFTIYRDDGIDEGYCTLVETSPAIPACPAGTEAKFLAPNLSVCTRSCGSAADCGRIGYTCDLRYLDLGLTCVRQCTLDLPDCIRSGHAQRPDGTITMHLLEEDLRGASACNVQAGLCEVNPGQGVAGIGETCDNTLECASGLLCIQGEVLAAAGAPAGGPGVCSRPCKPGIIGGNLPQGVGCLEAQGEVCQAGFTFGHGDPFDPDLQDSDGFLAIIPPDRLTEAGGWCMPRCDDDPSVCDGVFGTACGAANEVFGHGWNNIPMCLPPALRRGG